MPAPIEVTPDVWIEVKARSVHLSIESDYLDIAFKDVPAVSRALSIVKESKQYAAWLKKEGLA